MFCWDNYAIIWLELCSNGLYVAILIYDQYDPLTQCWAIIYDAVMTFNIFVTYLYFQYHSISIYDYMDTSIIIMWCNNSEVTVPAKLPKLYVIVI